MTARKRYAFTPDWAIRPGATIAETFRELSLTQREVAAQWGVSQPYISDIIHGRHAITAQIALRLEATTNVSAEMWMGLQSTYDLAIARGATDVSPSDFAALAEPES